MKQYFLFTIFLLASLLITSQALATNINDLIEPGFNVASDENREYLIDRNYDPDAVLGEEGYLGQLDVGDSFRGSININTVNSTSGNIGGDTGVDELTAVFQVMLASVDGTSYTFIADPDFEATYGDGAIAALYTDPAINFAADFDNTGAPVATDDGTTAPTNSPSANSSEDVSSGNYASEEAFIATATDGLHWATLGFSGADGAAGPGEGILTSLLISDASNVLTSFTLTQSTVFATVNMGLSLLDEGVAWDDNIRIDAVLPSIFGGNVQFTLSQDLKGIYDLDTPFEVSSNTDISFYATVIPEPSTYLLLGAGLLGLGILRRFSGKNN